LRKITSLHETEIEGEVGGAEAPATRFPVAVVIPCFRGGATIRQVIASIPAIVTRIYVVDDCCPDGTGSRLEGEVTDRRVMVLHNVRNLGVGGAVKRGYVEALRDGATIVVKVDADGQMDPSMIPLLIDPIRNGQADYAKGNRFAPDHRMPSGALQRSSKPMPVVRRLGNNILSFLHKGLTGYWNIVDPTNGYTAIHRRALESIDIEAVADCYFFETDMLFQLNLAAAAVVDVPIPAHYGDEVSSLSARRVAARFPWFATTRFWKRIYTKYYLQDFNVASLQILFGLPLLTLGTALGIYFWLGALNAGIPATAGEVMFAALPIMIGFQLILSAVSYDVANVPRVPISRDPVSSG
jgi:dolichol-phosphate mannosyltransferase